MRHLYSFLVVVLPLVMAATPNTISSVDGRWWSDFSGRLITVDASRRCLQVRGLTTRNRPVRFDRDRRTNRYFDSYGNSIAVYHGSLEYTNSRQRYTEVFNRRPSNQRPLRPCPGGQIGSGFDGITGVWYDQGGASLTIQSKRGQLRIRQGRSGRWIVYDRNRFGGYTSRCGTSRVEQRQDFLTWYGPRGNWRRYWR